MITYKNTDEIFATSPSFVDAICERGVKVDRKKMHYWPQYAEEFYKPCEKKAVDEIPDDAITMSPDMKRVEDDFVREVDNIHDDDSSQK